MEYRIGEAAAALGVSVRTLHYYDSIGLAGPARTGTAGYRVYDDGALGRVRQVLFWRGLGFSLREIGPLLETGDAPVPEDLRRLLRAHRELLLAKRNTLDGLLGRLDALLEESNMRQYNPDTLDAARAEEAKAQQLADEARRRWGDTEAWRESRRRSAARTPADQAALNEGAGAIFAAFAALRGHDPADPAVQALVGRWRQFITDSWYDCTPQILAGLGQMYTADERFAASLDAFGEGTAQLMSDAVAHYCAAL